MASSHIIIFSISLFCIVLELFFTRILNLKTWNHIVYVIIPFALLGCGIGANFYLIFHKTIDKFKKDNVIAFILFFLALTAVASAYFLIHLVVQMMYLVIFFISQKAVLTLLVAYSIIMIPFVFIGFLVVYLFSTDAQASHKLYFFDLLGAGLGAYVFFPLIENVGVFRSILLLSILTFLLFLLITFPRHKFKSIVFIILMSWIAFFTVSEPQNYHIDPSKGWEYIPSHFDKNSYETVVSKWNSLGRTDIYRFTDEKIRDELFKNQGPGVFGINLEPVPEFSYITTNFIAGTALFNLSEKELATKNSKIKLFSQVMELPYKLLNHPKVVIIGTGGGREIFIAKSHEAQEIIGAEINSTIYKTMSAGGQMHDYSGRIYTNEPTKIFNVDGRHLVKILKPNSYDLIVLTLVDTFTGLSSGAYAYAESYLYTKNAIFDYLRVINDDGFVVINRWLYSDKPREALRLFVTALEVLKDLGVKNPLDHIAVGSEEWAAVMIKKTPITPQQRLIMKNYFRSFNQKMVYPPYDTNQELKEPQLSFYGYAQAFKENQEKLFLKGYPYDISVITDDRPFFYKHNKLKFFKHGWTPDFYPIFHTGNIVFLAQGFILGEALLFVILFIFGPLLIFRTQRFKNIPSKVLIPFMVYFSCLGAGFMFFEISLMQKFTLLLGSPIYSISVTLAVLLITAGVGSLLVPLGEKVFGTKQKLLMLLTIFLISFFMISQLFGTRILDQCIGFPFAGRIILASLMLLPIGICLGMFFPSGLFLLSKERKDMLAWAWGLNCGFSVLGSILSIIIAQFYGFALVMSLACLMYVLAVLNFKKMALYLP